MMKRVSMPKQFAVLVLSCLLLVLTPAQAFCANITPEGAAHLKGFITRYLDYQKTFVAAKTGGSLQLDGEVLVEPLEDYYAVTLPHAAILYQNGIRFEIGIVSINASPHDKPGQWKMSAAIPTPMTGFNPAGEQMTRVILGGQRFAGIWDENMEYFMKLDASYKDITVENSAPGYTATIPEAQLRFDFTDDGKGFWNGPAFIRFANPRIKIAKDEAAVSAGEIKAQFNLKQYNPAAVKTYREQLAAIAETGAIAPGQAVSGQHAAGVYNMIMDMLANTGDGFTSQYSVNDFHLLKSTGEDIAFKTGFIGLDATGFAAGKVQLAARAGYSDFKMIPAPAGYEDVQPKDMNIDIVMENLPFRDITELGKNTIQSIAAQPAMGNLGMIGFLMKLPALLAQSGTHMTIKNNFVSNDEYKLELNGTARADMSAVNSATAEARGIFHGLDKLLARTQALGSTPDAQAAQNFRKLSANLQTLKNVAKVETIQTPAGNQFVHVFDFVMNPQGQMLLNDKDIFTVMAGQAYKEPAPVPAVEPATTP